MNRIALTLSPIAATMTGAVAAQAADTKNSEKQHKSQVTNTKRSNDTACRNDRKRCAANLFGLSGVGLLNSPGHKARSAPGKGSNAQQAFGPGKGSAAPQQFGPGKGSDAPQQFGNAKGSNAPPQGYKVGSPTPPKGYQTGTPPANANQGYSTGATPPVTPAGGQQGGYNGNGSNYGGNSGGGTNGAINNPADTKAKIEAAEQNKG